MARVQPLILQISPGDPRPISRQIVDAIRMKIATGELAPGAQLPSVRGLAQQLTVNPNTVAKAYAELTSGGWVDSRQGLGLYVAPPRQRLSEDERERRFDEAVQRFVHDVVAIDYPADRALARLDAELSAVAPRKSA
jgi:GntR family transcriptional regulator